MFRCSLLTNQKFDDWLLWIGGVWIYILVCDMINDGLPNGISIKNTAMQAVFFKPQVII